MRPKRVSLSLSLLIACGSPAIAQFPTYPAPAPVPARGSAVANRNPACDCGKRTGLSRAVHHASACKQRLKRATIGIREEYIELPLGQSLTGIFQTQVANGDAARMVLHRYDFVGNTAELNYRGRDKVQEIVRILPTSFAPVIVERTPNANQLDDARRAAVLAELNRSNFPVPAERVLVGMPMAAGRNGTEALLLDAARLGTLQSGAMQPFSSSGGGGGGGGVGGVGGFDTSGVSSGMSPR